MATWIHVTNMDTRVIEVNNGNIDRIYPWQNGYKLPMATVIVVIHENMDTSYQWQHGYKLPMATCIQVTYVRKHVLSPCNHHPTKYFP